MKIGIVGSGLVGATAAYALVMRGIGREIVLVDANKKRAQSEADDIRHAVPFAHPLEIKAGNFAELKGSQVVIIAAGVSQQPGESRLHLLERNAEVFRKIIPQILEKTPNTIILVATNPVDVMTHIAADFSRKIGVPSRKVLGTGTTLDTARFRTLLGKHLGVDSQHVHAYVVGEHGDSEVLTWSMATIGGIPLNKYSKIEGIKLTNKVKQEIDNYVRNAVLDLGRIEHGPVAANLKHDGVEARVGTVVDDAGHVVRRLVIEPRDPDCPHWLDHARAGLTARGHRQDRG